MPFASWESDEDFEEITPTLRKLLKRKASFAQRNESKVKKTKADAVEEAPFSLDNEKSETKSAKDEKEQSNSLAASFDNHRKQQNERKKEQKRLQIEPFLTSVVDGENAKEFRKSVETSSFDQDRETASKKCETEVTVAVEKKKERSPKNCSNSLERTNEPIEDKTAETEKSKAAEERRRVESDPFLRLTSTLNGNDENRNEKGAEKSEKCFIESAAMERTDALAFTQYEKEDSLKNSAAVDKDLTTELLQFSQEMETTEFSRNSALECE